MTALAEPEATRRNPLAVGVAGYDGGRMATAGLDHLFPVTSTSVHRIQEAQTSLLLALVAATAAALGVSVGSEPWTPSAA